GLGDEQKGWKNFVKVPAERVRELSDDEADRLDAVMRDDYRPFFDFAHASGLRLKECFLRWSEVDFGTRQIVKLGKGGKRVTVPITETVRDILWPLQGHHSDFVFTYVCEHSTQGRVKGERYPLTYNGLESYWRRLRERAGVTGFRFHDYRHDFATKLLRETGNLRLVPKALCHAPPAAAHRYADLLDEEVAHAPERGAKLRKKRVTRLTAV